MKSQTDPAQTDRAHRAPCPVAVIGHDCASRSSRVSRSSRALTGVCLILTLTLAGTLPASAAQEIAILKSADIAAYHQAVAAFKDTMGPSVLYTEYNLHGDPQEGRKLARKIRASDASLVLAVGLKAALA
ncbi:MAG: hypothetical protein HZB35_11375, partial [Nitrospirae bacterium]|nr:hypothetical protein [Nitrospirota bacterium]